ncbi:MAG: hypothetical protein IJ752_06355 [Alphaproteobacteria bacterium]|nr:hypothetical protein [Alphaproteobacteria bacterium]
MKGKLVLSALLFWGAVSVASAQVIDVRAISRQRGFRAYQPQAQRQPVRRQAAGSQGNRVAADSQTDAASVPSKKEEGQAASQQNKRQVDQTEEMQKYIANNPQVRPDI